MPFVLIYFTLLLYFISVFNYKMYLEIQQLKLKYIPASIWRWSSTFSRSCSCCKYSCELPGLTGVYAWYVNRRVASVSYYPWRLPIFCQYLPSFRDANYKQTKYYIRCSYNQLLVQLLGLHTITGMDYWITFKIVPRTENVSGSGDYPLKIKIQYCTTVDGKCWRGKIVVNELYV